jgi:O-antigen/teichoic acid export membrane protein
LHLARHDKAGLAAEIQRTSQCTLWATLAAAVPLLAIGPLLLAMFGPGFAHGGYGVLVILALGQLLRACAGQAEDLLIAEGKQRMLLKISATIAMLALAACILAASRHGIEGVAYAMAASVALRAHALALAAWTLSGHATFVTFALPNFARWSLR